MSLSRPNRGKDFEDTIKKAFEKVPNVSVDRLHDQMTGYKGSSNICDFIVYQYPIQMYVECKAVYGNTLPFSNITPNQKYGLNNKSSIKGVVAGILCWWIDKDITKFIPIDYILFLEATGKKSIRFDDASWQTYEIPGEKKRVFFEYDMQPLIRLLEKEVTQ